MKVRYTIHKRATMVGQVEEVSDDWGERLISAGQAVRAVSAEPAGKRAAAGGRRATPAGGSAAGVQGAGDSTPAAE